MAGRRLRKVTYSLPEDLIDRVRSVVKDGAAPSYSAFVEQALADLVRRAQEVQLAGAFQSAAEDPAFLGDIESAVGSFGGVSGDRGRENT